MRSVTEFVGAVVLIAFALWYLDAIDLKVCVGKPGTCSVQPAGKPGVTV